MNGVDPVLELLDLTSREPVEVRSLRVPPAHEAVAVLNGAFLVRGVGPCVVGLCAEDPVQPLLAEELASVVRRHAPDRRQGLAGLHATDRPDDLILVDVVDVLDDVSPAAPVQHDQKSAARPAPGDDGVHFVVPELPSLVRSLGSVPDLTPAGDRPGLVCGSPRFSSIAGMIGRLAVVDAHVASLDVIVERLQARHVPARECLEDGHPGVVGRPSQIQHEVPEEYRHADRELHLRPHVRLPLVPRGERLVDVVFRIDPRVPVAYRLVGRTSVVLPAPGLVGDAVERSESSQRDPVASVDVAVPGRSERLELLCS